MTKPNNTETVQGLIKAHGLGAPVKVGGFSLKLGQALAMEESFCPADPAARSNQQKSVAKIAGMLARGGSLLAEYSHLVPDDSE